jgi:hypothetical protein
MRRITRRHNEDRRQLDFKRPGFPRIQDGYTVVREGKSVLVPTEQLTPDELRAKAKETRAMGEGHLAHADELDRLADEREANDAR